GVYLEIAPPHRLVFEALDSTGRVQFTSVGDKTRMTLEIVCRSAEQLEQFLQMGVATGTAQTLDNLVAYIPRQDVVA
ncbi:MAG TPA: SRPBCC domain-containing protein, partial [Rhizomicrobium sp.]|nr:SRPBCC domain-containing protein [Rhizomicrobium sp.]